MRADQLGEQRAYVLERQPQQNGRGRGGRVGAGMDRQEAEQSRRTWCESVVGPRERRTWVGGGIIVGEAGQAAEGLAQVLGDGREAPARVDRGTGTDDGQRQRQGAAQRDDLVSGGRFLGDPLRAESLYEELPG